MNQITVFYDHIRNAMRQEHMCLEDVATRIVRAGISGTEIEYNELVGEPGKALAQQLQKVGLPVSGVYCQFRWDLNPPAVDYREVLKRLQELDIHYLLAIPGYKLKHQSSEESRNTLLPYLEKLCEEAKGYGVQVLMEDFDDVMTSFAFSHELNWYMQNLGDLGCAFDTGNFLYCEEDSLQVLPLFLERIRYVHCKDRSFEPVAGEEYKETINGRRMYSAAVGAGIISMREMISKILETGYTGPFAIEHFGSTRQLSDMLDSAGFLTTLMNQ